MSNVSDVSGVGDLGRHSEPLATQPKAKRKWPKYLVRGGLVLAVALVLGQVMYTLSGDEKWELVDQNRGVTVYAMKEPGRNVKKFMAVMRVKANLTQTVAFLQDDESDVDDGGFMESKLLKRESPTVRWTYWRMRLARPMDSRDYVVKHVFTQDPKTKEVLYSLTAKPYMLPEDKCCVRVLKMDNSWRLTPLKGGEVEIHWTIDMDIGGWAPYFIVNKWFPWEQLNFGSSMQEMVERPKYVNTKLDWIQNADL
jgi:hypothetical protein